MQGSGGRRDGRVGGRSGNWSQNHDRYSSELRGFVSRARPENLSQGPNVHSYAICWTKKANLSQTG